MFVIPTADDLIDFIKDFTGSTNTADRKRTENEDRKRRQIGEERRDRESQARQNVSNRVEREQRRTQPCAVA